ncbi:MAG: hypothetical protein GX975_01050 [Clostridiales bacterium]|nr:hypothetical protein [Clostridiales bacterium]
MRIKSDMLVLDIVEQYPQTDSVFREYDEIIGECLLCNCLFESVGSVAKEYQLDEAEMLRKLNEAVRK